ncbi:hypothetical protein BY996DRAFT_4511527 [Phakopsora pachyrhizi]|uniref:Uncharacterized protein n=1 Tax=Phakopsora pachyrhizi TaxID=170000 RepID=A0AAV0B0A7_PHAPC|nr:hypothetical protein BY996DRAFT_4511527 [Phakopsora pachyrhizi]CAH7676383.1 hypothetical protein PPACK8108_LOCUS11501 [Phakopsora pachyrhizi]
MMRHNSNGSPHNLHYCNVNYNRALKEHERLEKTYQMWLTQRDKVRRNLIAQIDRVKSSEKASNNSNSTSSSLTRTLQRLQSQLERMELEDNQSADPDTLQKQPHSLICQSPAYRKLSFQKALETAQDRIRMAEEAKSLAQKEIENYQAASDSKDQRAREPQGSSFRLGVQIDSFLGRLNSGQANTMTKKVSLIRSAQYGQPQDLGPNGDKWISKWGFHDVRASTFRPSDRRKSAKAQEQVLDDPEPPAPVAVEEEV